MNTYRVTYCKIPTNFNDDRVKFVEAESEDDARTLIKDYLERSTGYVSSLFSIRSIKLADNPSVKGQVL